MLLFINTDLIWRTVQRQPVFQIFSKVVSHKRPHCHWVMHDLLAGMFCCGGCLGLDTGSHHYTMFPAEAFKHQWDTYQWKTTITLLEKSPPPPPTDHAIRICRLIWQIHHPPPPTPHQTYHAIRICCWTLTCSYNHKLHGLFLLTHINLASF